jgi:site-specific DNA-methyltransferase (adenine-specific)
VEAVTPYWRSEDGRAVIYCGDALEVLPTLEPGVADAVIADPPYAFAGGASNGRDSVPSEQFFRTWFVQVWRAVEAVVAPDGHAFVFSDWRSATVIAAAIGNTSWTASQVLVWDREGTGMGSPFRNSFEVIVYAHGPTAKRPPSIPMNQRNVVRFQWPYGSHEYPAEKPIGLLRQLVRWLRPQRGVLDPFTGSGSALVACLQEDVNAIGIDLNPDYCDMARQRIDRELRQVRLPLEADV